MDQLSRICGPSDLHSLTDPELQALADEIREVILSCVSEVGGHLAASLGAVELTVALHSVLDSPRDKIVWDVGHQAYAHKIITGRARVLQHHPPVRRPLRVSLPRASRSTTSSAPATPRPRSATGWAWSRRPGCSGRADGHVVCVLGDGALTGGVAFEAMNQAGQLRTPLVVVLNDNQMSIKPNVGAFQLYLNRFRLDPGLTRLREDMERTHRPHPGDRRPQAYSLGKDVKESMKAFLGPGHDLRGARLRLHRRGRTATTCGALRESMRQAMDTRRPVLVHVKHGQGQGLRARRGAAGRVPRHRAVRPRQRRAQDGGRGGTTYTEAFGQALVREARRDPRVVAVTAAMTQGTGLEGFERRVPRAASTTWASPRSTPSCSPPGLALGRHAAGRGRSTRRSCSAPSTCSCRTSPCSTSPWSSPRQGGPRRRRRPHASRRLRPLVPAPDPRPRRHGALEPGAAAAHAAHRPDHRRPGRAALPARPGRAVRRRPQS